MMSLCYPMIIQFQAMGKVKESLVCSVLRKGVVDIPLLYLMDSLIPLYGCMTVQPIVDTLSLIFAIYFLFNKDDGDSGGYSPSENAIYINEYNMGDAKETVDTVAHESRHCWQHEMAENSDSPQAREFKENFEHYIEPEYDYRGYTNQPVEADARDYVRDITDNIPNEHANETLDSTSQISNTNPTREDIRQNEEGKGTVGEDGSC